MKKVILLFLLPVILLSGWKGNPRQRSAGLSKIKLYEYKQLDVNRINCTISSDGPYADYRKTFQAGMEWPKGSGKTCVFSAGIWIGGLHRPTDSLRMARVEFFSDFQPGPLLETFNTTTNDDTLAVNRAILQRYRLFKINSSDTLQGTANPDYLEWPGDLGAPYVDINNNGI